MSRSPTRRTDLFTPALFGLDQIDTYHCVISNVSTKTVTVNIRSINPDGSQAGSSGAFDLSPGQISFGLVGLAGGSTFGILARCVFEATGSKSHVRAHICITNYPGGICVSRADAD